MIDDNETLDSLNMGNQEPEYFYTEADVKKLLLEGTLDQLEDALNFAPEGVLKLIQDIAVAIEVPDTRKRKMISENAKQRIMMHFEKSVVLEQMVNYYHDVISDYKKSK